MEKKEQFFKTMNDYHKRLKEYVKSGDLEKDQNPDEWLWNRTQRELDKAREEGWKEKLEEINNCKHTIATNTLVHYEGKDRNKVVCNKCGLELSKLRQQVIVEKKEPKNIWNEWREEVLKMSDVKALLRKYDRISEEKMFKKNDWFKKLHKLLKDNK